MAFLVDTNVLVDFTRGLEKAADYLDSLGGSWSISMITCLELIAGARNEREASELDFVLRGCRTVAPNEDIARRAYYLTRTYARSHGLHTLDALIAATALEEGLALSTKNRRHFQMISDLTLDVPNY